MSLPTSVLVLDKLDDEQLLAAHVAGDPNAFDALFQRHRDRLWADRTADDA